MQKVLPTEKSLVVSFWTFFEISRQPRRIWWLKAGYSTFQCRL